MKKVFVPTQGAADWQRLLAKPDLHWKQAKSAMTTAACWEDAGDSLPPEVSQVLNSAGNAALTDLQLLAALPEWEVPLPGGTTSSMTDVLALARNQAGLVVIGVEGKVDEDFGPTVAEKLKPAPKKSAGKAVPSDGQAERLRFLRQQLELAEPLDETLRYQLLHRTFSALETARWFHADAAVMLIHSFASDDRLRQDYKRFCEAMGAKDVNEHVAVVPTFQAPRLFLAWCTGDERHRRMKVPSHMKGLSFKFDEAMAFAAELHREQTRKGTDTPYLGHLLSVAGLVLENGGSENQAIAALLHDAIEDQAETHGGAAVLGADIEHRFGREVRTIVEACTDAWVEPKPEWRQRKEAYLAHIPSMPKQAVLVSIADKLHNARSICVDLRADGLSVFSRFTGKREGTLWYYESLAGAFLEHHRVPLALELQRTVAEMKSLS